MHEMLNAAVPRNLRVRGSLQIAGSRVPIGVFGIGLAALLIGGIAVVAGADPPSTIQRMTLLTAAVIGVREARWWGYASGAFAGSVLRHLLRRRQIELMPVEISLPPEVVQIAAPRVRWRSQVE
jgi:hypothetical protein